MEEIFILLIIGQAIAIAIGAFALAQYFRRMRDAIASISVIAFFLPVIIYILSYSINPTLDKMVSFLEWFIPSVIVNEITGNIVAFISESLTGCR